MPRVSIVIPTYNRERLIGATLDSVMAQTFQDFEVVVVDDGSTDGTAELVRAYGARVRYLYQPNQGQGAARNTGLRAARGELVAFLDSDDLWEPNKLALQLAALADRPDCPWIYTDAFVFDGATGRRQFLFSRQCRPHEGMVADRLLRMNFIASPTPVIRREVFDRVGMFNELTPQVEDWDMWLRIAARYPIAYVPEALAGYRLHQATSTGSHTPLAIYAKALGTIEHVAALEPEIYGSSRHRGIASISIIAGRMLVSQGDIVTARRLFARASCLDPSQPLPYLLWAICLAGEPAMRATVALHRWWRYQMSLVKMQRVEVPDQLSEPEVDRQ